MKLSAEDIEAINEQADRAGIDRHKLFAVIEVESGGVTGTYVNGFFKPVIRWEGHYFYRLVPENRREVAVNLGLAHPEAGKIKNPKSQADRYNMYYTARQIDANAAIMSCSWGLGQVMGANWKDLGYDSPASLMTTACTGVPGQVDLMVRYIVANGLVPVLQRGDWASFARAYNGPNYRKNRYDTKLREAYERRSGVKSKKASGETGVLRMGATGKRVRELQSLLVKHGFSIKIDGDFGPATRRAVEKFQLRKGLTADGIAGPKTMQALMSGVAVEANAIEDRTLSDVPGVRKGGVSLIGGGGVAIAADKLGDLGDRLASLGITSPLVEWAAGGLYTASALLVVGGLAWAAWAIVQDGKTVEA